MGDDPNRSGDRRPIANVHLETTATFEDAARIHRALASEGFEVSDVVNPEGDDGDIFIEEGDKLV